MSACSWVSNGEQCRFPGSMSDGLKGDGRWFCALHFRSKDDPIACDEIVQRSLRWELLPNRAEAWVAMRRKEVYGGESPTVKALREQIAEHMAKRGKREEAA